MGFTVQVRGVAGLRDVQRRLDAVGDKGLGRIMAKQLQAASDELRTAIPASAAALLPHRGGYANTMSRSLQFRQSVRAAKSNAEVVFRTSAKGKTANRDVPAVNRGAVRHPVYGRSRPTRRGRKANPWAVTRARPGFVDRPVDRLRPEIARRMDAVVDYVAEQLGAK